MEKEPIEWIVLKKETNRCLCVNKYLLDCKSYHEVSEKITWEDYSLTKWLNNEFLLFSPERYFFVNDFEAILFMLCDTNTYITLLIFLFQAKSPIFFIGNYQGGRFIVSMPIIIYNTNQNSTDYLTLNLCHESKSIF